MRLRYVVGLMLAAACGTSNPSPNPDAPQSGCASIAGTWFTEGTCGSDVCRITQNGCAITQVTCDSGAHSTSGTINGSQFSYTGESGTGTPATCSGTLSGGSFAGTCNINGLGTCGFNGQRQ
jgi:hypothetical protein